MTYRKKLIEVALPLEAINAESAREKSIRHGHPSTLHLWWARRPLAACRAVLFASLVDDPSSRPEEFPTEEAQERERQRLFRIIEELVKWENINNETVLDAARREIQKSTNGNPPPVLDPFCGGGSIPLEAQRLGLKAYASDLNPVAVLITKALIEIPPRFAGRPPVNPEARKKMANASEWRGAAGLADDVRYYGKWMRDEAEKRIGHLYPKVKLPKDYGGGEATVIAWLWARTVKCPNPACGATMPLVRSFWLSTNAEKKTWVEPVISKKTVRFAIKTGEPSAKSAIQIGVGTGLLNQSGKKVKATFICPVCTAGTVKGDYIDAEADKGRMSIMPLAIVAEARKKGKKKPMRVYLPFDEKQTEIALDETRKVLSKPGMSDKIPNEPARGTFASNAQGRVYGFKTFADYFTPRQLVTLATFSELVREARTVIKTDAIAAETDNDDKPLHASGINETEYADAIATYLAFAVSRTINTLCTLSRWTASRNQTVTAFARQAIPMTWDFPDVNPFAGAAGDIGISAYSVCAAIAGLPQGKDGQVKQLDAAAASIEIDRPLISTDPPYYDNVGYSDLSDFFYVWLRRSLGDIYPDLFSTLLTPKSQELTASPLRFDDREKAEEHFLIGLGKVFRQLRERVHHDFPMSVYYAFRQAEEDEEGEDDTALASTGWETMLEGLLLAGFQITGTIPMRTELSNRPVASDANALASSIVLVCRPRQENAPLATRREFITALRRELPDALKKLQQGNVAPVDFAQATIGPGMAIFSRYSKILEADGSPMRVRAALQLINQELETYFAEQEGDLDSDTRFCIAWFEQKGMEEGAFGEADVLARAKNTSVAGLVEAGVFKAKSGKVRLLKRDELLEDWNPLKDARLTVWECAQYLIRALDLGGEEGAAKLAAQLGGGRSEDARALAYRLYAICERKGWTQAALAYNSIVASWGDVQAKTASITTVSQPKLGAEF